MSRRFTVFQRQHLQKGTQMLINMVLVLGRIWRTKLLGFVPGPD